MRNFLKLAVATFVALVMTIPAFATAMATGSAEVSGKVSATATLDNYNSTRQDQYQSQTLFQKPLVIKVDRTRSTIRTFHLNREVTNEGPIKYESLKSTTSEYMKHENTELAKNLFALDGVHCVSFSNRYQVSIDIGKAFDVKKTEEQATKVIADYFGSSALLVSDLDEKRVDIQKTQNQPGKKSHKKKFRQ